MKDCCDEKSVNSSPIPEFNFTSKEIQKEIKRRQKKQIHSEVVKEMGELVDTQHKKCRRDSFEQAGNKSPRTCIWYNSHEKP